MTIQSGQLQWFIFCSALGAPDSTFSNGDSNTTQPRHAINIFNASYSYGSACIYANTIRRLRPRTGCLTAGISSSLSSPSVSMSSSLTAASGGGMYGVPRARLVVGGLGGVGLFLRPLCILTTSSSSTSFFHLAGSLASYMCPSSCGYRSERSFLMPCTYGVVSCEFRRNHQWHFMLDGHVVGENDVLRKIFRHVSLLYIMLFPLGELGGVAQVRLMY